MKNHRRVKSNGSALVMTLLIIVMLTVIILAGFVTTQLSMQSSRSQLDAFAASEFAEDAVDQAISLIRYGTSTNHWITQPGEITQYETDSTNVVTKIILHSGLATNPNEGVNANAASIQNPTEGTVSYDLGDSMPLGWIYVRKNGERTTNATYSSANPIVGRYAFWVDDESSKVNVNTAWTRAVGNTNSDSHASKIPLQGAFTNLTETQVSEIADYRANRFFSSQLDVLKAFGTNAPSFADNVRQAKFWTTHINSSAASSELTHFGDPKIVLTTKKERAGGRPYLNTDTTGTPPSEALKTIGLIAEYLEKSDWAMAPGETFQEKYYGGEAQKHRLKQIALNIMEYVKAKESPEPIIKPWRAFIDKLNKTPVSAGPSRRFRMVEIGFWKNKSDLTKGRAYFVFHLPKNIGLASATFNDIKIDWTPPAQTLPGFQGGLLPFTLRAGEYKLLSLPMGSLPKYPYPGKDCFITVTWKENGQLRVFDIYPTDGDAERSIDNTLDIPITVSDPLSSTDPYTPKSITDIQTISVGDPFLGGSRSDWTITPNFNNFSYASKTSDQNDTSNPEPIRNLAGLGKSPINPALGQDLDKNGKVTDEGVVLPPPAGTAPANGLPGNLSGMVESLSELGYIHTGIQSPGLKSVPFRTLRMQPRSKDAGYSADSIPDWAILDLFTLPVKPTETNALLYRTNARGGLVSLNSAIQPFTNIVRQQSLRTLVKDLPDVTETEQQEMAANLMRKVPANNSLVAGKIYGDTNIFRFPGEIAEIKGVSDTGEASEQNFRKLIDLVTTSGNVFSIYSIGQSVTQTPSGKIVPRGEYRQVSIVERSAEAGGVKFRVLFNKSLGY